MSLASSPCGILQKREFQMSIGKTYEYLFFIQIDYLYTLIERVSLDFLVEKNELKMRWGEIGCSFCLFITFWNILMLGYYFRTCTLFELINFTKVEAVSSLLSTQVLRYWGWGCSNMIRVWVFLVFVSCTFAKSPW